MRVLATTNRNLRAEVAAGRFREDLYYRLNVFPLTTAPLRERRDDVLPLAMHVLNARCRPGERIPALSAEAAHVLLTHAWPGNVRELDNVMQRALILANGPVIEAEHIHVREAARAVDVERRASASSARCLQIRSSRRRARPDSRSAARRQRQSPAQWRSASASARAPCVTSSRSCAKPASKF